MHVGIMKIWEEVHLIVITAHYEKKNFPHYSRIALSSDIRKQNLCLKFRRKTYIVWKSIVKVDNT